MSRWATYVIGLALALPMGGYVAGSLMASAHEDPGNREPVRISDQPGAPRTDDDPRKPERPERPAEPPARESVEAPPAPDDDTDDDVDDNGVRVVTPQPTRLDDGDEDGGGGGADDDGDDDDDRESRDRSRDDRD